MELIVLIIHLLVCICLIGLVLLQRSEGGALGMGGGGAGSLMSGRGASDALAKMTSVAGGFFLVTSLSLTFLSGAAASADGGSVFDNFVPREQSAPLTPAPAPAQPEAPRPDPTESSLPAETQMASAAAPGPVEAATTTRAAPLAAAPPAQEQARPAPASTTQSATRQPATSTQRTTSETSRTPETQRLVLPSSGGVSGVNLMEESLLPSESIEIGRGVEAVRRERAGPDQ